MKRRKVKEEFFDNCIPEPNSGCWLWERAIQGDGYGIIWIGNKSYLAHRIAYQEVNGPITLGACVCHKCDNPICVNPDHLFLGSHLENMRDRAKKGRSRNGDRKGEKHPLSKLRPEDIKNIRDDERRHHLIAVDFGISRQTVSAIKSRKTWSHL